MSTELTDRFWEKVDKSDGCWLWTGALSHNGYGHFRHQGATRIAHRLVYAEANGPIPEGMQIDHTCWTHECVNPAHLRLATHKSNGQNRDGAYSNSTSGLRGVSWNASRNKWQAEARLLGKKHYLGLFSTAHEADIAVSAWRRANMPYSLQDQELSTPTGDTK